MNLHPYLTTDLLALIRTADAKALEDKFNYSHRRDDSEWLRLDFNIDFRRAKSLSMYSYHSRPIKIITMSSGHGSDTVKRRVELSKPDWRELFIQRFNEVLHDCERRHAVSKARQDANVAASIQAASRKNEVEPLIQPLPPEITWRCRNNGQNVVEDMNIETDAFTPSQIKQIVDLIRRFNP